MADHDPHSPPPGVATGYALLRLERALETLVSHPDPAVRERAAKKIARWRGVLAGMANGTLTVGSRTPVADTPAWVTLEVAHGGFATGAYLAEGPLEDDERALLARLPHELQGSTPRERMNLYYLSDAGLQELCEALRAGSYRVRVPEEGALPVVAWLVEHDHFDLALDLIATLRPLMHRLRFYPLRAEQPRAVGALVRLRTVREVAVDLRQTRLNPRIATEHEALRVWNPLYDRLVALWAETVDGAPPRLQDERVVGGWPCAHWPAGWTDRREAWLADYATAATTHTRCGKHRHRKSNFCRLREALELCPGNSSALEPRAVGQVRRALANTQTRRGVVGGAQRTALRSLQAAWASLPSNVDLAQLVAARLDAFPPDGGLPSLQAVAAPAAESESPNVPSGHAIPRGLLAKSARALEAPLDELVERGVIGSSEVLAVVLPQLTAQIAAAGIADVALRSIYEQVYAAFRRRRSLLLLNLESQVRLEELPWIQVLEGFRADSLSTRAQARQTLEQVTLLALCAFPQTLLPNPLVGELSALAKRAQLGLPLVQEVAADIFMGTFTDTWRRAAQDAAESLEGTIYARYYDLPAASQWAEEPAKKGGTSKRVATGFAAACTERAKEALAGGSSYVAQNGAVLEQSQILTTHNLATLVAGLGLESRLRGLAPTLAADCFAWLVRRQTQPCETWRAQLQAIKNSAYAWRQALFLLAYCDETAQAQAVEDFAQLVAGANPAWAARFQPALEGLRRVLAGERFDRAGKLGNGRRFLGWSVGKHWLLPQ